MSEATLEPDWSVDPLRVEFADARVEQGFQRYHLSRSRVSLRITLVFCSLFYIAFALTDLAALGVGSAMLTLLAGRIVVALTACIGLYLIRDSETIAAQWTVASAAEIVGMATFMLIVWFRPGEMPWHAMSLCIMLLVIYVFIPNRQSIAIGIGFAATAAFIAIALAKGELRPSDDVTMSMLLLLSNSFGIVAARRYHRLWRDEYRALMELQAVSIRDHLTGCFNRHHLHATLLPTEVSQARSAKRWMTLMVCDIDHFKRVNDEHGHHTGDAVLQHVSALLQTTTRTQLDSVVRYGGEEFLLVMAQTDLDDAMTVAENLRTTVSERPLMGPDGGRIAVTVSIGVLAIDFGAPGSDVPFAGWIAAADKLLYEAKRSGRNGIRSQQWGRV